LTNYNWYKTLIVQFIVFNHSNQFDKAYDTYLKAVSHSNFSKQYSEVREIWYINEAYVYYFHVKAAISTPVNKRLKKFRLNKFLNEVPVFSRDKRGMNINILILHVLLLLHRKEYEKVADRAEALRAYTKRYLRKDETFRSNCFIKMLIQIPASNFHKAAVSRNTADLYKKLTSVGIAHNKSAEVEIVPYETLWEFALSSLDYKLH
jgi:tetratricopeptide (TPR) repeat protein